MGFRLGQWVGERAFRWGQEAHVLICATEEAYLSCFVLRLLTYQVLRSVLLSDTNNLLISFFALHEIIAAFGSRRFPNSLPPGRLYVSRQALTLLLCSSTQTLLWFCPLTSSALSHQNSVSISGKTSSTDGQISKLPQSQQILGSWSPQIREIVFHIVRTSSNNMAVGRLVTCVVPR